MRLSKKQFQITVWSITFFIVLGHSLYSIPREFPQIGFWESLFIALRFFMFEQELPAFPKTFPLIAALFIAPMVTLSVLGTAIKYIFRIGPSIRSRYISDHVIVCGLGRTGSIIAETLRDKGVQIVGVDLGPRENLEEWIEATGAPVIFGDFHSKAILKSAGAECARSILFTSGNDLANLEGALAAYDLLKTDGGDVRLIWAHIANEALAEKARIALRTRGNVGIRFFDTYHIAATKMIGQYFNKQSRNGIAEVTILGFGKFGRDVFDVLGRDIDPSEKIQIKVVDKHDRREEVMELAADIGIADKVSFLQADIQYLDLVEAAEKSFFLCTDDDLGNLTAAMGLVSKVDATHIYVRMAQWPLSAVVEHLGAERGVVFVNINELVLQGIEQLPGIFKPAAQSDIKRRAEKD